MPAPNFTSTNPDSAMADAKNNAGVGTSTNPIFPSNLTSYPDYMQLFFYSYKRNDPLKQNTANHVGTISLPLPLNGLQDTYQTIYNKIDGGILGGIMNVGDNIINDIKGGDWGGALSAGGSAGADVIKNSGLIFSTTILETINSFLNERIGVNNLLDLDTGSNLISQALGKTVNPNPSLTFAGVQLKKHQWTWKLTARNSDESSAIENIIYLLKKNALPARENNTSNFILNYPSIVDVYFSNPNHKLIETSDQGMVIEELRIDFEPDGNAMFFKGGQPVSVIIELGLNERSIMTSDKLQKPVSISNQVSQTTTGTGTNVVTGGSTATSAM